MKPTVLIGSMMAAMAGLLAGPVPTARSGRVLTSGRRLGQRIPDFAAVPVSGGRRRRRKASRYFITKPKSTHRRVPVFRIRQLVNAGILPPGEAADFLRSFAGGRDTSTYAWLQRKYGV